MSTPDPSVTDWVPVWATQQAVDLSVYQTRSEKGQPSGYVGLDANSKIVFQGDAASTLYRISSGWVGTDGGFWVNNDQGLLTFGSTVAQNALRARVTGDAQNRFQIGTDGKTQWGPGGTTAVDTNLYRSAAAILKTDGALLATNTWIKIASVNYNGASFGQTITIPSGIKSVIFIGNITCPAGGATGFYYRSNGISAACYQCEYSTAVGNGTVSSNQQVDAAQGLCGIANGDWLNTASIMIWTSVDVQWSNWGMIWFSLLFTTTGTGGLRWDSGGTLCRNASGAMTSLSFMDGGGRNYTMQGTFWGIPV